MKKETNIVNDQLVMNLEVYTKLSREQRKNHINWLSRQNVEFQIMIFEEQRNQFFKLKNSNIDLKVISLAAFYLAIKYFYEKEKLLNSKNKSQSLEAIGGITKIELVKMKKQKQKEQALLNLFSVVEKLHNEGYSLREIASVLQSKYRKNVSHTYVGQFIKDHITKDGQ